jgi:hypothetical protein
MLLLAACGGGEDGEFAQTQAAITKAKQELAEREARIEALTKQVRDLRAEPGVPPMQWGKRPAAKFMDARYDKLAKDTNGRIYELDAQGEFNLDPETMLGLFVEIQWRASGHEAADGKGARNAAAVEADMKEYRQVRYICLLVTDEYKAPDAGTASLSRVDFTPGLWRGRAFYLDIDDKKMLGGKEIKVTNPQKLEFESDAQSDAEVQKAALQAAIDDLRKQIQSSAANP